MPHALGVKGSYVDVLVMGVNARGQANMSELVRYVVGERGSMEDLAWLRSCALGEVKNKEILNDLAIRLKEHDFLDCRIKYVGGLRVLLECANPVLLSKLLDNGKECLSKWFEWIAPWDEKLELNHPCHLVWLSIVGVLLHTWSARNSLL